jgi:Fibronectin type III-like domain
VSSDGAVTVTVRDSNRGSRAGADVIEGYVHDPETTGEPPEQLRAFARVYLAPGETRIVQLTFHPSAFAYWNSGPATGTTPTTTSPAAVQAARSPEPPGHWVVAPGMYRIDIGGSSSQFDDSTWLRLDGTTTDAARGGLFGWSLPARAESG